MGHIIATFIGALLFLAVQHFFGTTVALVVFGVLTALAVLGLVALAVYLFFARVVVRTVQGRDGNPITFQSREW
jgi:hypothetical protein